MARSLLMIKAGQLLDLVCDNERAPERKLNAIREP